MNFVEILAKSKGVNPKNLYSGKYGKSVDQIILNLSKL
tara:strand:+ start:486 stop:599 length:114 start_codon:yes stop_codon:yes gene_type:complete